MEGGVVTCYTSFPLAGCTENIPEAFYLHGRNKANVILPWPQDLHFNECWANCHVYVLYLSISISAAPSRLPLSYCLSPCQGAIICNLPKSSICRDTKHENGAIWCKMEAGEGLTYACVCVEEAERGPAAGGGPRRKHQDIKVKINVMNVHAKCTCVYLPVCTQDGVKVTLQCWNVRLAVPPHDPASARQPRPWPGPTGGPCRRANVWCQRK